MQKDILRTLINLCMVIVSIFAVSACGQSQNQFVEALNIHKPLGLAWNSNEFRSEEAIRECSKKIKIIKKLLTKAETNILLDDCISEQYDTMYLPKNKIIPKLQKGAISALIIGENQPVMYTYSYLHELNPTKKTLKKKKLHAAELMKVLSELYGRPKAHGYFNEGSKLGFVISKESEKPCDYWIEQNIGIFLCSERVIYMDGFEMSLSFVKLDNNRYSKALRNMILSNDDQDNTLTKAPTVVETKNKKITAYESILILTKWLNKPFNECTSDKLKPIENTWSLSTEDQKEFSLVLKNNTGKALAEYAFDLASNNPNKLAKQDRDRITLYILKHAAERGSASAMNEIGVSLLDCSLNVQQDLSSAKTWFDKAIAGGDLFALLNRARMALLYEPGLFKPRQRAIKLLEKCAKENSSVCGEQLSALQLITSLETKKH